MKKIIAATLMMIMLFATAASAAEIKVTIYDEPVEFDVPPMAINNRTMVPMRKIFEALGAEVEWFGESQLILANKGSKIISMRLGEYTFSVTDILSGETKIVELDSPPVAIDQRTLVPVRAISESLDMKVQWVQEEQLVKIYN